MAKDFEQQIGLEGQSRLTNPDLLVKTGFEFLEKYKEDLHKIADFYGERSRESSESPVEDMEKKHDAFIFLTDRLSTLFPEFGEKLQTIEEHGQSYYLHVS